MNLDDIRSHWEKLSRQFETDLKATTKTPTIKKLEVDAFYRAIKKTELYNKDGVAVLEVGCGNGHNCFALSDFFPNFIFTGVDYIPEMIKNAKSNLSSSFEKRINFYEGDALDLRKNSELKDKYDIVFTDRCIINLNTGELQKKAIEELIAKVKSGGYLIILENIVQTHANQNDCREAIGLPRRKPAEYNLFINETNLLEWTRSLDLVHVDNFGSLHDLVLYVLVPKINSGEIDYSHPFVEAATELSIKTSEKFENGFGNFGQNRLYLFKKSEDARD